MTIPKITPAIHYTVLHDTFHAPSCRLRGAPGTLNHVKQLHVQASCSHDRGQAECNLRLHEHGAHKLAQCQMAWRLAGGPVTIPVPISVATRMVLATRTPRTAKKHSQKRCGPGGSSASVSCATTILCISIVSGTRAEPWQCCTPSYMHVIVR